MPLADEILRLTQQHGRPEEKQLLSRWQEELRHFLHPFEREILAGQLSLEIGLEPKLVLKMVIKRRKLPPIAGLLRIISQLSPSLQQVALQVAKTGQDFHIGIRLAPDAIHREIYVYNHGGDSLSLPPMPPPPEKLLVTAYGVDERQGLSAYFTSQDNPILLERLRPRQLELNALLKADLNPYITGMWLHFRLQNHAWLPAKFGLEYKNAPLNITTRALSHFKPPYFNYLIPRQALREMVIGGTDHFCAYYFTVL